MQAEYNRTQMKSKYGYDLPICPQPTQATNSVLGDLSAPMMFNSGKKRASKGILSKMAKS